MMKKRVVSVVLAAVMLLSLCSLAACGSNQPEAGTLTRMTVDINPSIEFMVDDQNKIISVTALNDDGSVLLAGEAFLGKTPEEATEQLLSLAADTGYLVKGNATAEENTVKISVSGDTSYSEKLQKKLEKTANDTLKELDVTGKVEQAAALKSGALRALAKTTSLYTDEELAAMSDAELYRVISEGRIETATLLTEDMREAYYAAKAYKISLAEREETAKVIESMGSFYTVIHATYLQSLQLYSDAIKEVEEFRYDTLVSPESAYQKALTELRASKAELLKQRTYVASLDVNGENYASATLTLQMTEEEYNKALAVFEKLGADATAALDALIATMKTVEVELQKVEALLFSDDVKAKLQEKAADIDTALNAAKDQFFADFEAAHAADIAAAKTALAQQKAALQTPTEG